MDYETQTRHFKNEQKSIAAHYLACAKKAVSPYLKAALMRGYHRCEKASR